MSLDKFFILSRYSLLETELRWFCCSLSLCIGRIGRGIQLWGGLLGSSGCSVEISALVFCSIVLRGGGVLRGCLLPCSVVVGAWSLCLVEVAGDSCLYIPSL